MPSNPPVPSTSTAQLQRKRTYPYGGRLIVLESGRTTGFDPFAGLSSFVAINFPSMPDSVELSRSVEYLVVNNQVMPDGIHQYKSTQPLSIPMSFKLHSFDKDFCPQGALSLLQVSALLHSFSLPISGSGTGTTVQVTASQTQPGAAPSNQTDSKVGRAQTTDSPYSVTPESGSDFAPPVTLRLELMFVDENSPGIICTGYIKDVRVRLIGPWLRGPGRSSNLPTSAEYEFTFVHVPGYGNGFNLAANTVNPDATLAQAFADDVRQKFYNTRDLTLISGNSYKGLST